MPSLSGQQVSEAGEHYVLYRLYMCGMVGGQAPRGMPETDLLVMTPDGETVATVQVKARVGPRRNPGWHMQAKHEEITRANLYYVFVGMEETPPLTYIIPSSVVADVVGRAHRTWLATPGRKGQERRDSKFRWMTSDYELPDLAEYPPGWIEQYRERWDLITSASSDSTVS